MGYKLADGSDSEIYQNGDTFMCGRFKGKIINLPNRLEPVFQPDDEGPAFADQFVAWNQLFPTEETKRKVAEQNQPKCKCGYVIPVVEIGPDRSVDFGEPLEQPEDALDIPLRYLFGWDCEKPRDEPEPLARIIDWRGGEAHSPRDIIVNDNGDTATMLKMHHMLGKEGWNTLVSINTAVIPKQRTMTKAGVEREFGIKVVD